MTARRGSLVLAVIELVATGGRALAIVALGAAAFLYSTLTRGGTTA